MKHILLILAIFFSMGSTIPDNTLVASGYKNGKKFAFNIGHVNVRGPNNEEIILEKQAAESFNDLMAEAAVRGFHISVNYGFRTHQEQRFWYNKFQHRCKTNSRYCNMAAKPGYSMHQEGRSVDISKTILYMKEFKVNELPEKRKALVKARCTKLSNGQYVCKTILYWWLKRNAKEFGFYNDVPNEPWHWTFYGKNEIDVGG